LILALAILKGADPRLFGRPFDQLPSIRLKHRFLLFLRSRETYRKGTAWSLVAGAKAEDREKPLTGAEKTLLEAKVLERTDLGAAKVLFVVPREKSSSPAT
jgi:hypothetical protein